MRLWHVDLDPWSGRCHNGATDQWVEVIRASNFRRPDIEGLENQFCPPGSYPQFSSIEIFAFMAYVAEGAFRLERLPPYAARRDLSGIRVETRGAAEDENHIRLKKIATAWLIDEKGAGEVCYEQPYYSGIADVASADGRWFVECGATRPSKAWDLFRHESAKLSNFVVFNWDVVMIVSAGPRIAEYRDLVNLWR